MGTSHVAYKEVRFVLEDDLTQVYVSIIDVGNPMETPIGVVGWHHKTFPKSKSILDIMEIMKHDDPMMWAQEAP